MTAAGAPSNDLTDVLDRVLDKGIVIEAWVSKGFLELNAWSPRRGG